MLWIVTEVVRNGWFVTRYRDWIGPWKIKSRFEPEASWIKWRCSNQYTLIFYCWCTKRIRKVRTVCEYFRCSTEVVISRMHSLASQTPIREKQIVFTYYFVRWKCSRPSSALLSVKYGVIRFLNAYCQICAICGKNATSNGMVRKWKKVPQRSW
jgi:hypothetical protein